NSAKRMRLRTTQFRERCNPLGQALGWTAAIPERESFARRWRRGRPRKQTRRTVLPRSTAEIEAQGDAEGALTRIDEALALAAETGEHWSDAFLHRLRGEILLKRDPANTAPAEEAFLTALTLVGIDPPWLMGMDPPCGRWSS